MGRDAVDDRVIQANARRARETVQTLEVGDAAMLHDKIVDQLIQLPGGHASLDVLAAVLQCRCAEGVCPAHSVQFFRVLDLNHFYASRAFMTSAVVSSMEGQNLISASLPRVR